MPKNEKDPRRPRSLSPTPLRDLIESQPLRIRAALVILGSLLIACGGKAGIFLEMSPVAATQQTLFALLAGALLGSRLGSLSAVTYLLAASLFGGIWPVGAGPTPLVGILSGYLWSLPLVAFLSGYFVERARSEQPVHFAIGACAAIALYDAVGSLRLMVSMNSGAAEAVAKGAGLFVGQHLAQGALTVLIASSTSMAVQARQNK